MATKYPNHGFVGISHAISIVEGLSTQTRFVFWCDPSALFSFRTRNGLHANKHNVWIKGVDKAGGTG